MSSPLSRVPKLTVVFDRSAFHGARFDLISNSPLRSLVTRNVVRVHHTYTFLEETLSLYVREKNREELRRQLPFLLGICNGGWLRDRQDIWEREIVWNRGPMAAVFLSQKERRQREQQMHEGAFSSARWNILDALPQKDIERQKSERLRQIHVQARNDVAGQLRLRPWIKTNEAPTAVQFIERELVRWGEQIICRYVGKRGRWRYVDLWRASPQRYPFFKSSMEGQIFAFWHAMVEQNKPIDGNAHVDVEMLCALNKADAIISADTKFLKDAFDALWRPRGKLFFSPEAFCNFLQLLA